MTRVQGILVRIVAFGIVPLVTAAWSHRPTQRAAPTTYSNSQYGYSISYPADWIRTAVSNEDLNEVSPERDAFLAVGTIGLPRPLTPAEMNKMMSDQLVELGASPAAIKSSMGMIHGSLFYVQQAVVNGNGAKMNDIFLETQRQGRLYAFNGGWAPGTPQAALEQAQIEAGFGSITFAE